MRIWFHATSEAIMGISTSLTSYYSAIYANRRTQLDKLGPQLHRHCHSWGQTLNDSSRLEHSEADMTWETHQALPAHQSLCRLSWRHLCREPDLSARTDEVSGTAVSGPNTPSQKFKQQSQQGLQQIAEREKVMGKLESRWSQLYHRLWKTTETHQVLPAISKAEEAHMHGLVKISFYKGLLSHFLARATVSMPVLHQGHRRQGANANRRLTQASANHATTMHWEVRQIGVRKGQ